jgi:Tfp pilus assembly protein PilN
MKAVNLIPAERRSQSGVGSYVVLGVLALVVAMGAAYTLVGKSVSDRRRDLSEIQARAQASHEQAESLKAYTSFTAVRQKRTETVRSLAASRFDWSHALHEVSRTIPSDAWLTGLRATVSPSATVDGGVTDPLRSASSAPAVEIVGCTTSQDKVAAVISSLRRIDGVQRVSLSSSERLEATAEGNGTGDSATASSSDCRNGNTRYPQFSMTLFFDAPPAAPTAAKGTTP